MKLLLNSSHENFHSTTNLEENPLCAKGSMPLGFEAFSPEAAVKDTSLEDLL